MRQYAVSTPRGTRDLVYGECARRREAEGRLAALFCARGYTEIITPVLEYYDVIGRAGQTEAPEALLKLIDRSGRILALRPDMTTPIARFAATKLGGRVLPQHFYYVQTVFRAGERAGRGGEIRQAGVELLGAGGLRADAQVTALALEALSRVAGKFRLEIGHAGFFRALAASLGADETLTEALRMRVEEKNFASLGDLLTPFAGQPAYEALRRLPELFGGEEVLDEARALAEGTAAAQELDYLRLLWRELSDAGWGDQVMIDFGLVHHMDYYTGAVFRGYVDGAGGAVLSGGRYDTLTEAFGQAMPATGFALDVDAVCAAGAGQEGEGSAPRRYLLHVAPGYLRRAADFCDRHRPGACELSPCERVEDSLRLARDKGIAQLVVIDAAGATAMPAAEGGERA